MSETTSFKNSYVCPECYCADGWKTVDKNVDGYKLLAANKITQEYLECQHCHVWVPLVNVLEYNKTNSGWFRLD